MNKNQKKLALSVFVACMLYFCYKTIHGLVTLGEYTGWRFYALLTGTILFGGMAAASIYYYPRVKEAYNKED